MITAGATAACLWYFWSSHANKGRAVQILYWMEKSLCGHGHVTGIRWVSRSEFDVPLRLASNIFRHASVRVKIGGIKQPLRWIKRGTNEAETITFRADLDYTPAFSAEMNNLRWFARSRKENDFNSPGWEFERAAPLVLTTRLDWGKEITSAMQSMIGLEEKEDVQVTFRKTSPNFSVTLPLEKITPESETPVFELLCSIAAYSSAEAS